LAKQLPTSIYLNEEARAALDWLREQPGGFNLAGYVHTQIIQLATERGWRGGMRMEDHQAVILTSARGLTVRLTAPSFARLVVEHGNYAAARAAALNRAGTVLKHRQHRRELALIREQQLSPEQIAQTEALARTHARAEMIDREIARHYPECLARRDRGGMLPEASWNRIVAQATRECADEEPVITDGHREVAMYDLGLFTARDAEHSSRQVASCDWEITAPSDWDA
jgi:hypothetical protein